jgi:hypothetical protein
MRRCSICGSFLVPCNESIDHIGVSVRSMPSYNRGQYGIEDRRKFICQSCLYVPTTLIYRIMESRDPDLRRSRSIGTIQNQVEYGISYQYAEV